MNVPISSAYFFSGFVLPNCSSLLAYIRAGLEVLLRPPILFLTSPRRKTPALTQTAYLYYAKLSYSAWELFYGFAEIEKMESWADVNPVEVPRDKFAISRPERYAANVQEKWLARLRKEAPVHYSSQSMCGCDQRQVSRRRIRQIMRITFAKVDPRAQRVRPEPASNRADEHRAGFRLPI